MQSPGIRLKLHWLATGLAIVVALSGASRAGAQGSPVSNVQATAASLATPAQVAFDAVGNLYIADLNNNVIRKVNLAGIVTTVAGTGDQGFSGDGGAATDALLDSPAGVAVDGAGDVYIADTHNQRIRKVSGGTITTIAGTGVAGFSGDGGPATSATLSNPSALALDANGNLYIADTDNHRIRMISGTTITTVAGSGEQFFSGDNAAATAAGLDSPNGVAVDAFGNLYIGDTHNQRVRVVSSSGTISTLAGNANKAYAGDGGAANAASLARPRGLSVDSQGNIYVADSDNNRIRLIAKTGNISTVAGNGSQGFAGDGGPAVNATLDTPRAPAVQSPGVFALSDTNNQVVREVGLDGTIHTIAGVSPGIGSGTGVAGETLTLSGASSMVYGSGALTAIFTNGSQIATGQVSLLDTTAGSTPVATATLTTNVATIDVSALSAGTHRLVVTYAGDTQNPSITSGVFVLTVTPLPVTASATGVSLQYGQVIPAITGTLTGVLPRDANNVVAVFTTPATQTSPIGQYPVSVTLTGSAAGNYTVTLASGSGSIAIGKAASAVTLTSSSTTPYLGASVTLTAQVASATTGTPTGNVSFYDGTTLLTSVPVSSTGAAAYTSSTFALGTHSITAVYSGDANFTASTSTGLLETVSADFTITANGATALAVNPGQTATYNFNLQSQGTPVTSAITLTASGLPAGAKAVFTPASVTLGSTATQLNLVIQTARLTAANGSRRSPARKPMISLSAVLFLLPLLRRKHIGVGSTRMLRAVLFVLIAGATALGLTGCGDAGFFPQSPKTYTITITAAATNPTVQHNATVTLVVE